MSHLPLPTVTEQTKLTLLPILGGSPMRFRRPLVHLLALSTLLMPGAAFSQNPQPQTRPAPGGNQGNRPPQGGGNRPGQGNPGGGNRPNPGNPGNGGNRPSPGNPGKGGNRPAPGNRG